MSVSLRALLLVSVFVTGSAFGTGPAHAQGATPAGNVEAGLAKSSSCIGCHGIPGYRASFPNVYSVPMIVGQSGRYIESALIAYRKGDRSHPTMRAIAGSLTDQDIADLAALYASN
jgi:cytochrome c553